LGNGKTCESCIFLIRGRGEGEEPTQNYKEKNTQRMRKRGVPETFQYTVNNKRKIRQKEKKTVFRQLGERQGRFGSSK